MSKAAALSKRFGENINQSIGLRTVTAPAVTTPSDVIPMATKDQGRKRIREAGLMELDRIIPDPAQPRREFNSQRLEELSKSIARFGVLSPISIRWSAEEAKHIIIAGERRYRAAKMANLSEIPCIFSDDGSLPDSELMLRQLTENIQRDELTPMDAARAFDSLRKTEGWTAVQIAEALSVSKGLVSQRLKLLELPEEIQAKVEDGTLSGAHGYQLARVKDPEEQKQIVERVETEGLSRDAVKEALDSTNGKTKSKEPKPGRPVTVKQFKTAKAQVSIKFNKKRVGTEEIVAALEEVLGTLRAA